MADDLAERIEQHIRNSRLAIEAVAETAPGMELESRGMAEAGEHKGCWLIVAKGKGRWQLYVVDLVNQRVTLLYDKDLKEQQEIEAERKRAYDDEGT